MKTRYLRVPLTIVFGTIGSIVMSCSNPALAYQCPSQIPCTSMPPELSQGSQYNVILIVGDDVGVDMVGCYASQYDGFANLPCTPNLDALAADGVRFTNVWSSPVCTPSRAQIMTGRPAHETGMGEVTNPTKPDRPGLDPALDTIGKLVTSNAAVGKWHLADESQWPAHPLDSGFASFSGTFYNIGDYWNWPYWPTASCDEATTETQYATALTAADAIDKLDLLKQGSEPWLLYVAFNAPHGPFECPGTEHCSSTPDICGLEPQPCGYNWCAECGESGGNDAAEARAAMQALDHYIGSLLADVECDNTVVIFVGDNGTAQQVVQSPFNADRAKGTVYQGGVNVPLIIRAPGDEMHQPVRGEVCNALVSVSDLFATVADFLGAEIPSTVDQSYSLRGYTEEGFEIQPRCYVYTEIFSPPFRPVNEAAPLGYRATRQDRAIRNDKYKLIDKWTETGQHTYELYQLFDGALDPLEFPAPQNPEDIGDLAFEEEEDNLLCGNCSLGGSALSAFCALKAALESRYAAFPMGSVTPVAVSLVKSASYQTGQPGIYTCNTDIIKIDATRPQPNKTKVTRAFLEFTLPTLQTDDVITRAMLDVPVKLGGSKPTTEVGAWPVINGNVSTLNCLNGNLFNSRGAAPYTSVGEWMDETDFCPPITKTLDLTTAIQHINEERTGDGKFCVALTLMSEEPTETIELFDFNDQTSNDDRYQLRLYHYFDAYGQAPKDAPRVEPVAAANLTAAYPNPSRAEARIAYSLRQPGHVSLQIFNAQGQLVRTLVDDVQPAAERHEIVWDGTNDRGERVGSGVYFSHLSAEGVSETKRIMIVK